MIFMFINNSSQLFGGTYNRRRELKQTLSTDVGWFLFAKCFLFYHRDWFLRSQQQQQRQEQQHSVEQ